MKSNKWETIVGFLLFSILSCTDKAPGAATAIEVDPFRYFSTLTSLKAPLPIAKAQNHLIGSSDHVTSALAGSSATSKNLRYSITTPPKIGKITSLNPDTGEFTYVLNSVVDFLSNRGQDYFGFTVSDEEQTSRESIVTIESKKELSCPVSNTTPTEFPDVSAMIGSMGFTELKMAGFDHNFAPTFESTIGGVRRILHSYYHYDNDGNIESSPVNAAESHAGTVSFDTKTKIFTKNYGWGSVSLNYRTEGNKLIIDTRVENTSSDVLAKFKLMPEAIELPSPPKGYNYDTNYYSSVSSYSRENIVSANIVFDEGVIFLTAENEDAFQVSIAKHNNQLAVQIYYINLDLGDVAPNSIKNAKIALRFGTGDEKSYSLLDDIISDFKIRFPQQFFWPDRRLMSMIHISNSPTAGLLNKTGNPRGWSMFPSKNVEDITDPKENINTPEGKANLRDRLMSWTDYAVASMLANDVPGAIVWSIEGQESAHAISYIGSPAEIGMVAPEMDSLADEFMSKFTDAGLRIGVAIRPQRLEASSSGALYPWRQVLLQTDDEKFQELDRQISYSINRWGATLFYIDSNGYNPWYPDSQNIFARLHKKYPQILLMPEAETLAYYAVSAPMIWRHTVSDLVRYVYPCAFGVDLGIDYGEEDRAEETYRQGNTSLIQSWWANPRNTIAIDLFATFGKDYR